MRAALIIVAIAVVVAVAPAAAAPAQLRLVDPTPVTLRGASFAPGERIEVHVKLGSKSAKRFVRGDASGRFLVRFAGFVYDRCHGALTVAAVGGRGTRAGFTLQPLDCPAEGRALAAAELVRSATTRSGLYGKVTRGPLTPVCMVGTPCSGPAAGVTLRFLRNGALVARAVTAKDGSYRVGLSPATYAVRLTSTPKVGRGLEPTSAHVAAGRWTRTDFSIDTGIR
jgi:hypothetical protein